MTLPLQFLGYGVRCTDVPRGWATNTPVAVDEICSVSDCVNSRPEGWVERWDYNSACCYETEEAATRTAEGRPGFRLLAYALGLDFPPRSWLGAKHLLDKKPAENGHVDELNSVGSTHRDDTGKAGSPRPTFLVAKETKYGPAAEPVRAHEFCGRDVENVVTLKW